MTTDHPSPPPHMCATCHHVLNPLELLGTGEITWTHSLPTDHPPVPVLQLEPVMICDFCSAPDPTWAAECTPFLTNTNEVVPGVNLDAQDDGLWAACDPCAGYIRRNDWPRLLYRAEKQFSKLLGEPAVGPLIAHMHDQFRHHFTGVVTRTGRGADGAT